jgi:hypothetical protein
MVMFVMRCSYDRSERSRAGHDSVDHRAGRLRLRANVSRLRTIFAARSDSLRIVSRPRFVFSSISEGGRWDSRSAVRWWRRVVQLVRGAGIVWPSAASFSACRSLMQVAGLIFEFRAADVTDEASMRPIHHVTAIGVRRHLDPEAELSTRRRRLVVGDGAFRGEPFDKGGSCLRIDKSRGVEWANLPIAHFGRMPTITLRYGLAARVVVLAGRAARCRRLREPPEQPCEGVGAVLVQGFRPAMEAVSASRCSGIARGSRSAPFSGSPSPTRRNFHLPSTDRDIDADRAGYAVRLPLSDASFGVAPSDEAVGVVLIAEPRIRSNTEHNWRLQGGPRTNAASSASIGRAGM